MDGLSSKTDISRAVREIKDVLEIARTNSAKAVNVELLKAYWKIGEIIVRYEQDDNIRAAYGQQTLLHFSKTLTKEIGKGFFRSNIYNMRQLYLYYRNFQTLSGKLSWSHYCELLGISDDTKVSLGVRQRIYVCRDAAKNYN